MLSLEQLLTYFGISAIIFTIGFLVFGFYLWIINLRLINYVKKNYYKVYISLFYEKLPMVNPYKGIRYILSSKNDNDKFIFKSKILWKKISITSLSCFVAAIVMLSIALIIAYFNGLLV